MKHQLKSLALLVVAALAATARALEHPLGTVCAANTYDAAVETHESTVRLTNAAAISARHLLYYQSSAGVATVATAAIPALGTIDNTETSTGVGMTVKLLGKGGTKKMVASEAVTVGARVFQAASGKVATYGTIYVGQAITAASADGDVLEVDDSAAVSQPGSTAVAATRTVDAAEMDGRTFFFGHATEFVMTLPAPFAGARAKFICTAAPSGASYTIVTASSANIIKGHVLSSDLDAAGDADSETSGGDTISFVDAKAVAGDWVELECDGTNWFASGRCKAFDAITITTAS